MKGDQDREGSKKEKKRNVVVGSFLILTQFIPIWCCNVECVSIISRYRSIEYIP